MKQRDTVPITNIGRQAMHYRFYHLYYRKKSLLRQDEGQQKRFRKQSLSEQSTPMLSHQDTHLFDERHQPQNSSETISFY